MDHPQGEVEGVSPDKPGNGGRFIVRMEAPCNYWGLRRLGSIKAPLVNASDAMAIGAFMRASGRDRASYRLELQDLVVLQEWTVPPTA